MQRHPPEHRRRRLLEIAVRFIDVLVYGVVFLGGIYAIIATPVSVVDSLVGFEWLANLWAILLIVGGGGGLLGRLTGRWLVENPATVASAFGIIIYVVVLFQYTFTSITAVVATCLAIVSVGFMVRRWLELQMFGSEPDIPKIKAALARRTGNVVTTL